MPDIKTREVDRTLKIRDAAARLPKELVHDIAVKSGDSVKSTFLPASYGEQGPSPTEDAGDRLQTGMEWTADHGGRATWSAGEKAARMVAKRHQEQLVPGEPSEEVPSGMDLKEQEIRVKQTGGVQMKTKDRMEAARKRAGSSGRLSTSAAERIKSRGSVEKAGRGSTAAREQGHRTYQAGKQLAVRGKSMAGKGVRETVSGVKAAAKSAAAAVKTTLAPAMAGGVVVLLVIVFGVIGGISVSSVSSSTEALSQEVLAYTSTIQRYASQYGIPEYVASIQAIMMQESGGRGTDPMQASECPYNTRYPNNPGTIQDPEYSIQVGVQYYADCVNQAGCENPADLNRLQLSWQGYNYGNGYIGWALTNYGGYSLENALEFSQQQAAAHGWSGYGDPEYVPHVQRYYSDGNIFAGLFGNQQIVTIAQNEIGASDGQKYWSWYGFGSYQEWCACFVSWCGEQAGLIDSGAMPRFSLCSDGMSWFQSQGKWQAAGNTPTAGSLIFFDWGGDGVSDHVAIVEKCENGIIYTIEGNTSIRVNGESVRGVWQHQYEIHNSSIMGYGQ